MGPSFRLFLSLLFVPLLAGTGLAIASESATDDPGIITGTVQSAETGKPLVGANVAVRRAPDSTLVNGTTTDSTGHFAVHDLPTGRYIVDVTFMGYAPQSRAVTLTAETPRRTLDSVQLRNTASQMEETTVSAERPLVTTKGSQRIYNFEKRQVALAGKSAIDVLQNLPALRVDEMDGSIQLRGNQSVSIHVNGDPVSMSGTALVQFLKGLSADDIDRVEINTNPSARHDAEGTAGIVNIVLDRTEERGLGGGVSGSAGIGPRLDGSGNLSYQKNPWTLYGSYSYSHNERGLAQTLLRSQPDGSGLLLDQSTTETNAFGSHSFTAEIDYNLTPKTTLSLTSTGSIWNSGTNERRIARRPMEASTRTRTLETNDHTVHLDERLSFSHNFEEKNHELSADLRYQTANDRDRVREERVPTPPRIRESDREAEHEPSVEIDYTRPVGDWTLETGYKGSLRDLNQRYEVDALETATGGRSTGPDRSDALAFREQVHAGYGVLQHSFGPLDAEVGLRMEHTQTTIDAPKQPSDRTQYTDLFPSASLTYKMGTGRRVSLSYSKRIDRPGAHQLNAFDASSDRYIRFLGNPSLEPETIHKAELTVMQNIGPATVTVTPYARRKTNAIEWATTQTDSVTLRTYENYDARTSFGAELTSSIQVGEDFKGTLSGNVFRRRTRGGALDQGASRTAFAVMGRANATWTVIPNLRLQVSQMYRSPVTAGVGRIDSFVRTSASLERTFWNDRATLGLQVEDPFDTSQIGLMKQTEDFRERYVRDWDGRSVSLTVSYRFGDSDQKKRRGGSSGNGGGLGGMGDR